MGTLAQMIVVWSCFSVTVAVQASGVGTTAHYSADKRELAVSLNGIQRFKYTFNKGGAVNGVFDLSIAPQTNLVGESFQGESTDRVIQWTYWNSRYEGAPHDLGDGDVRANVTMEGRFHEDATCQVVSSPTSGPARTLVFESTIEHWFYKVLDRHGQPRFDTKSTYQVLDDGSLKLTRSVFRHAWKLRDVTVRTWDGNQWIRQHMPETHLLATHEMAGSVTSYFEAWTPLNRAVLPKQSHGRGSFESDGYQFWDPSGLGGWAMAHSDSLAFAVVFGEKQPANDDHKTRSVFNKLDLPQHNLNILLPAVETDWPEFTDLIQTLIFVVGSPTEVLERAQSLVPGVGPPRIRYRS